MQVSLGNCGSHASGVPSHVHGDGSLLRIWDANNPAAFNTWVDNWNGWPHREVFAHPAYLNLFKSETDRVIGAYFECAAGKVFYPFLLRDLTNQPFWNAADGPAVDLATPLGYGGPEGWDITDRKALTSRFWQTFAEWAASVGLVSEFVRLSLFTETLVDDPSERQFRQHNVVRSLDVDEPELWTDFRHKVRKNVQRARRSDVRVEVDQNAARLDDFLRIYWATMDRRSADGGFYFDSKFFERLVTEINGQFSLFHAVCGGRVISTELVLISAHNIYSFLGGTDAQFFEMRPNDLLKFEIMLWAKEAGKRRYVLGGGALPDDGIFRYKLSFAPSGAMDFWLRKHIVCSDRYHLFVRRRAAARKANRNEPLVDTEFFPEYRA